MSKARVPKVVGQAVCAAAMLDAARAALVEANALSPAGRKQAERVHRWFKDASCAVMPEGIPDTTIRKTMQHAASAMRIADVVMPEARTFAPFIVARIDAAWVFIEHQVINNRAMFGREWRYFLQTAWTFLVMIWPDVAVEERRIGKFSEAMFVEFAA